MEKNFMNLIKKFLFLAAPRSLRFFEQIGLWWTLFLVSEYDLIKRAGLCILILFYSIRAAFVDFEFTLEKGAIRLPQYFKDLQLNTLYFCPINYVSLEKSENWPDNLVMTDKVSGALSELDKFWSSGDLRPCYIIAKLSKDWDIPESAVVYLLIFSRKEKIKKATEYSTLNRKRYSLTKDEILENFSLNYDYLLHF